jgi:phosphoribosylglycinamide formyltransferase-1
MEKLKGKKIRFGLMASGRGSNALNLLDYLQGRDDLEVVVVISDQESAPILDKVPVGGPPVVCLSVSQDKTIPLDERKKQQEKQVLATLDKYEVDWLLLAGYMRLLSPTFIEKFWDGERSKIINIHPSLLPQYPGLRAYERAYEDEVKQAGITVHFVDQGVDSGPIILQKSFERDPAESFERFQERGLAIEHQIYPEALEKLFPRKDT